MIRFFQRMRPFIVGCRSRFAYAAIGAALVAATQGLLVLLIQPVLDGIFIEGDRHLHRILPPLFVLLYLIQGAGRYLQTYELAWIGEDVVRRLRNRLLSHMLELELDFFTRARGGELVSRTTNDIARVRLAVSEHLGVVVRESLVVVALIGVVFYRSPLLAVVGLIIIPVASWPISRLAARVKALSLRSQEKDSDITSRLTEIFNNIEIIKTNHSECFEHERFALENLRFQRLNMRGVRAREMAGPVMEVVGAAAAALVIWFGGNLIISGRMTAGEFTSFASAILLLYTPLKRISIFYNKLHDAVAASERIFELLDRRPTIVGGDRIPGEMVERVEFHDVHLAYGDAVALRGVSLRLDRGTSVAVVGSSGGGKTSMINVLLRLYDPIRGRIEINGVDLREVDLEWFRSRVGIVSQRVYLFNDTVTANICYGREFDRDRVVDALKQADAYSFVSKLAQGIDTIIDEFGANLSGGQRQRLAIARAIYRNPDILIFDEATSALDTRTESAVHQAVRRLLADRITVMVGHRLSVTALTERILVLADGVIVGDGRHEALMTTCENYRNLVVVDGAGRADAAPAAVESPAETWS